MTKTPPSKIDQAQVLEYLILKENHTNRENTRHYKDGQLQTDFYGLAICSYDEDPSKGIYLFYCDENWEALNDTYHDTVEDAKAQAAFEFTISINDWVKK